MIVEYTRYRISQDRQRAFEQAYQNAQQYLHISPHCIGYELSHCREDPERYVLRIEWVSEEEHLQGFRHEPDFTNFFSSVQPFTSEIEEMRHYELTGVIGKGGADARRSVYA